MAERRMFSKIIIDSDTFLDMPTSTQNLYFHLCMRADDDGFINSPNSISKMVGANKNDMELLLAKQFIIPFQSGVCVIRHWKIHNYIRNDRYKETQYKTEKALLTEDENREYTIGIPTGYQMDTQVRLGKDSIELDKVSIDITCSPSVNDRKNIEKLFISFWEKYPRKQSKQYALKAFAKIKPTDETLKIILQGLENSLQKDKRFYTGEFTPLASSWLNAKGWEDVLTENKCGNQSPQIKQVNAHIYDKHTDIDFAGVYTDLDSLEDLV